MKMIESIRDMVEGESAARLVDAKNLFTAKSSGKLDHAFRSIEEQIENILTENAGIGDYGSWRAKRGNLGYGEWVSASNHFKLEMAGLKDLLKLEKLYPKALADGIRTELTAKCNLAQAYSIVSYVQALELLVSFVPKLNEIVFDQLSQLATQGHSALLEELLTDPKYDWTKWISFRDGLPDFANKDGRPSESFISGFLANADSGSLIQLDELFYRYADLLDLSVGEYLRCKIAVIKRRELQMSLDDEQYAALASPHPATLVRARAGSGKTRTLCAKATLSIHDENLSPDQTMVVAFNKSAADEVRQRMRKEFGCPDFENARTFHSLAYQLAKPKKTLLFDEGNHPSQRAQSGFVQSLLERILNPAFKELLYQFFRKEIEEVERLGRDLAPEEYRTFRRSLEQVSLKGGRVKWAGEKYIADFLFEHDIPYSYEKIWEWGTFEQGQPYKPDFTLVANGSDFILEHWAIDPRDRSAQLPDEWGVTADQYRQQIARKRMFWADEHHATGNPLWGTRWRAGSV